MKWFLTRRIFGAFGATAVTESMLAKNSPLAEKFARGTPRGSVRARQRQKKTP
jgi:hypothetical protein